MPEHLRDAHYSGAKRLGHGEGYRYAHDFPEHFVVQDHLGAEKHYYEPSDQGAEQKIRERVERWRALVAQAKVPGSTSKAPPLEPPACEQQSATSGKAGGLKEFANPPAEPEVSHDK